MSCRRSCCAAPTPMPSCPPSLVGPHVDHAEVAGRLRDLCSSGAAQAFHADPQLRQEAVRRRTRSMHASMRWPHTTHPETCPETPTAGSRSSCPSAVPGMRPPWHSSAPAGSTCGAGGGVERVARQCAHVTLYRRTAVLHEGPARPGGCARRQARLQLAHSATFRSPRVDTSPRPLESAARNAPVPPPAAAAAAAATSAGGRAGRKQASIPAAACSVMECCKSSRAHLGVAEAARLGPPPATRRRRSPAGPQ